METSRQAIAIVTALPLERDAVVRLLTNVVEGVVDGRTIHRGHFGGRPVVVECFHGMGNVKSAVRTTLVIECWKPSAILLVGIAGGTKKPASELLTAQDQCLGDVLIAEQIIDYESGKQTDQGFENRPQVFRSTARWIEAAKNLNAEGWTPNITVLRPDEATGRNTSQIHFGVVASGQKVIKDQAPLDAISSLFTNLVGVEMEGIGAAAASFDRFHPVEFLLVKAICDWADPEKNDKWQPYAAEAAADCLAQIIRRVEAAELATQNAASSTPQFLPVPPKVIFTQRLGESWEELADILQIPVYEKATFPKGNEPRRIWEWAERRGQIENLVSALHTIGRNDLAELVRPFP